ncbi:MAG TPA: LodA/GoxA family CTQ-dependent oxidase [Polyangiaceae bacterium]
MARIFRIHPSIGIARVGNASRDSFFVGPEVPGIPANFDFSKKVFQGFKQAGLVRPQAAQFRVWEYEELPDGSLRPVREALAGQGGVVEISWGIHLANRKAAFFRFNGQQGADDDFANNRLRNPSVIGSDREPRLVIDSALRSISGAKAAPVALTNPNSTSSADIPDIGELRTDDVGRLQVIGGRGRTSQHGPDIADYVNNDGWFDDVGDGPVTATVVVQGAGGPETIAAQAAWVIVAPPDFAPAIGNVVSLYDTMWDVAVRELPSLPPLASFASGGPLQMLRAQREDWAKTGKSFSSYEPSFATEIAPLLERAFMATFVHAPPPGTPFHQTLDPSQWQLLRDDDVARQTVFARLRDPDGKDASANQMPKGLGDEYVDEGDVPPGDPRRLNQKRYFALTRYQYGLLRQWALGKFRRDGDGPARTAAIEFTPDGLDRAALENCVGGPFFPGIEVSWLVRNAKIYCEPFRIAAGAPVGQLSIGPGFFTQQMALPWQADFRDCKREEVTDPTTGKLTSAMWWAGQRPDDVYTENDPTAQVAWARAPFFNASDDDPARYAEMKSNWFKQGFVSKLVQGIWVETERG